MWIFTAMKPQTLCRFLPISFYPKRLRAVLSTSFVFLISGLVFAQKAVPVYKNRSATVDARIRDLLGRMTVEEKVGQLSVLLGWEMYEKTSAGISVSERFKKAIADEKIGMLWATLRADPWTQKTIITGLNPALSATAANAIQRYAIGHSRLGIPMMLAEECPHGHMAIGTTVFPTSIGQASTWNPSLIRNMARAIASETRAQGAHIGYGPILDLAREPRWSRVEETYGEDPVLISRLGEAVVQGFQGSSLRSDSTVISTLKHFTAYGVPEGGHNAGPVTVGDRELHQSYLAPFQAAVAAGAGSVMAAYNAVDGVPCSANHMLLTEVLRNQWKFNGFTVSDLLSISGLNGRQKVAATAPEAASLAINAGLDADLSGSGFGKALLAAVKNGSVKMPVLDTAVARVLAQKFRLGLFENPYADSSKASKQARSPEHIALARQVARESIVLLKNNAILPLSKSLRSIAVIGPNADNVYNQLGDYTAPQADRAIITVLQGIRNKLPSAQIRYVKGTAIRDTTSSDIPEAVSAARAAELTVIVLGGSSARDFKTSYEATGAANVNSQSKELSDMESGEGFDRSSLGMLGRQLELLKAVAATGKPVVLVTIEGRPLNINWAAENIPAILQAWYPGQEGGNAIADVLFGDYNPSGRLPISIPRSVGQLPVYYNTMKPERHEYMDGDYLPLYAFGHGLSYTKFNYQNLAINTSEKAGKIDVSITLNVQNTGTTDGDEVVQLYVRDLVSSVITPVLQLKKFEKVFMRKGETKAVSFVLSEKDIFLYNLSMKKVVEPGEFEVLIGSSSDKILLRKKFAVKTGITVK
jgi:beta-glucosidase